MSLERFHPHAQQHVFPASDQLPPLTGTLRLYVDGTTGNDAASGQGGWGNAWKTWAKVIRSIGSVLALCPTELTVVQYYRGVFTQQDLDLAGVLCGTTRVHLVHRIDDHTTYRDGTVTAVDGEAPAPKHNLNRLTLNVIPVLDGTEVGMTVVLDATDGSLSRATSTVLRVDVANQRIWTAMLIGAWPGWVATANAKIVYPASYTDGIVSVAWFCNTSPDISPSAVTVQEPTSFVVGMRCAEMTLRGSVLGLAGCYIRNLGGTWGPIQVYGGDRISTKYSRFITGAKQEFLSDTLATDFGIIGGATPAATNRLAVGASVFDVYGGFNLTACGYFSTDINAQRTEEITVQRASFAVVFGAEPSWVSVVNSIVRGNASYWFSATLGAVVKAEKFTNYPADLPATGSAAAFAANRGGKVRLSAATMEGENTGTGTCHLAHAQSNGHILFEAGVPSTLKAKNIQLNADGGEIAVSSGDVAWGSNFGGGPDAYVGSSPSSLDLRGNVTKSAVNSETAIQNGVDGQIVAVGTKFQSASAAFTAAHIGRSIKVSGSATPANNAVHLITAYTSPTEVIIGASVGLVNDGPGRTWGLVGTPQPIIECARGGRVSQASGKTFNVRKPEVDPDTGLQEWNNYGYGPNGFIYEHENSEATLGTLVEAAGIATATGIAARLRNRSTLLHTGGAVPLGVAPLVLGGNPPSAWPATALSEPTEGCTIIPNV